MITNALKQAFPTPLPICNWSIEELASQISTMNDLERVVVNNFHALQDEILKTFNIHSLIDYAGMKDIVLRDALGSEKLMNSSQEGLSSMFRNALLSLKNFFMNLWASIVAFFKRMFDTNSRTRTTLYNLQREFDKNRSNDADLKLQTVDLYLPTYKESVEVISSLEILYHDVMELSKVPSIQDAATFKTGITQFGYTVKDGVIYEVNPYKIKAGRMTMKSSDWSVEHLKQITNRVAMLCTQAAELNDLKNSLENDVTASIRTIDKYIALGDDAGAQQLQYELNNKSLRASYVFKCAVVFQSYVTQMSGMLIDTWNNILTVN